MSERSKHKKQQRTHASSSLSSSSSASSPSSFADDKLIKKPPSLLTLKYLLSPTTRSVILLNLITFLTFSFFLFHYLWLSSRTCLLPPNSSRTTTKIYVYELPRKFTYGVIESYHLARAPSRLRSLSDGGDNLIRYPGHQHSAEWYLFSDLNRSQHLRPGGGFPAVLRVSDPEKADLFFVPFFSSLSLIVNPKTVESMGCGNDGNELCYSDEMMQEEVMEWLEKQRFWKRNNGRDHVFVCQDPNAMGKVSERLRNAVLLVSDFGRLRGDKASLVKDVIVPYFHRINSFKGDVGVDGRSTLLFFMGNRYRKEGGKIRDLLFQILEGEKDVIIKHGAQSRESRRVATQGMHTSKFCLHPAGDTPSACRLFDAIVSLCIPVIVSDYIELPFEDVVDYTKLAVFVDTQKAIKRGYLTKLLRKTSTERILRYQKEIKAVRHYFEYEDTNGTTVYEIWRQVNLKVPLIKLMINRDKRLVERKLEYSDCSCICSTANRTVSFSHDHKQKLR